MPGQYQGGKGGPRKDGTMVVPYRSSSARVATKTIVVSRLASPGVSASRPKGRRCAHRPTSLFHVFFLPEIPSSNTTTAAIDSDVIIAVGRALCSLVLLYRGCLVLDTEPNADCCDGEEDEAWVACALWRNEVSFEGRGQEGLLG
jgi:hypothetical protein